MIVGAVAGFYIARSQLASDSERLLAAQDELALVKKALSGAEERNWIYYQETESLKVQLEQARSNGSTPTTNTTDGSSLPRSYREGVYLVGKDILPGTYDGIVTGDVGYWARLKSTDGIVAAIIANGLPRGPFVLTIIKSDMALELRGVVITAR